MRTCPIKKLADWPLLSQVFETCESPLWLLDHELTPILQNTAATDLGVGLAQPTLFFKSPVWQANCQQAFQNRKLVFEVPIEQMNYRFSLSVLEQAGYTYLLVRAEFQDSQATNLKHFQQIIDFIPNAVFVKNRDHQWVLVNRAFSQIMGHSPEELLGKSDFDFLPADQAEIFWAKDDEAFKSGEISINEECLTNMEGQEYWLLTQKMTFYSEDNEAFLVGTAIDITERKDLENQLEKACLHAELSSTAKADFLTKTSHEMRTSLSAILGFSQVLQKSVPASKAAHQLYLSRIHQNGLHLLNLINDLLDLSRIEKGNLNIHYEDCDLNSLFEAIAETFHAKLQLHKLTLDLDLTPLKLNTDGLRLTQVVSNLVDNAIKHTPAGGQITLCTYFTPSGSFVIEVNDTGVGMAPEFQASVFDLFQQEKPGSEGMGIGLAISQQICEKLGYQLVLAGSTPAGSCFQIQIQI